MKRRLIDDDLFRFPLIAVVISIGGIYLGMTFMGDSRLEVLGFLLLAAGVFFTPLAVYGSALWVLGATWSLFERRIIAPFIALAVAANHLALASPSIAVADWAAVP